MKLVKEHINEKFTEDGDPIRDMGIGLKHLVKKWLEEQNIEKYRINKDLTIDVLTNLHLRGLKEWPDYIKFKKIHGYMNIECVKFKSGKLHGMPKFVDKYLYLSDNNIKTLEGLENTTVKEDLGVSQSHQLKSFKGFPKFVGGDLRSYYSTHLKEKDYKDIQKYGILKGKILTH
jgi:hypothetical protein